MVKPIIPHAVGLILKEKLVSDRYKLELTFYIVAIV